MPRTLLLITMVSLLLLAAALISGRVLAPNLLPRITRDGHPRTYWLQVAVLGLLTIALLAVALHASPVLTPR